MVMSREAILSSAMRLMPRAADIIDARDVARRAMPPQPAMLRHMPTLSSHARADAAMLLMIIFAMRRAPHAANASAASLSAMREARRLFRSARSDAARAIF